MNRRGVGREPMEENDKGLIWKLPELRIRNFGKVGPLFAIGVGCGAGFGIGLIGGTGIGPGIPGLQLGFGVGVGCGIGAGFGYGLGGGIAYDDKTKYSNIGRFSHGIGTLPTQDELGAVMEELVINTKKLIQVTSKEIDKWRR